MLSAVRTNCQAGETPLKSQVDQLITRVKWLENENNRLKCENRTTDSIFYTALRTEIFETFTGLTQLNSDFRNTIDKIALTGLFTKLMQANNPASDILGFRFKDVIFASAEKHFTETLKNETDKKRFSQVIGKIIGNPVVSSLVNTNPITSVVASIISTIAGFSTTHAELIRESGKIKDVDVTQEDAFKNSEIEAFRNELQIYIDFYDALIILSNRYLDGLISLNNKYSHLLQSVEEYKHILYSELSGNENNLLMKLSAALPDPATEGLNFRQTLNNPGLGNLRIQTAKYPFLKQEVNYFKKEYNLLLMNYLTEYINTLEMTKDFPEEAIDKLKAQALINEIRIFIKDQVNTE